MLQRTGIAGQESASRRSIVQSSNLALLSTRTDQAIVPVTVDSLSNHSPRPVVDPVDSESWSTDGFSPTSFMGQGVPLLQLPSRDSSPVTSPERPKTPDRTLGHPTSDMFGSNSGHFLEVAVIRATFTQRLVDSGTFCVALHVGTCSANTRTLPASALAPAVWDEVVRLPLLDAVHLQKLLVELILFPLHGTEELVIGQVVVPLSLLRAGSAEPVTIALPDDLGNLYLCLLLAPSRADTASIGEAIWNSYDPVVPDADETIAVGGSDDSEPETESSAPPPRGPAASPTKSPSPIISSPPRPPPTRATGRIRPVRVAT